MNCLFALYDALVSIDVPADKARAVVSALEQDMSLNVATKADIQSLDQRIRYESELARKDTKALERGMTVRLGAMQAATIGLLLAAMRLMI